MRIGTTTRFGALITKLRKDREWTQREAALTVGISNAYLAQLEKGRRQPPTKAVLKKMAEAYQVELDTLMKEAGKLEEAGQPLPPQQLEWAYQTVLRDPRFTFGTRTSFSGITDDDKLFLVELYSRATGIDLLRDWSANPTTEL